jgi:hypothetical protein
MRKVAFVTHLAVAIVFKVTTFSCFVLRVIDLLLRLAITETSSFHSTRRVLHDGTCLINLLVSLLGVRHPIEHHVLGLLLLLHLLVHINCNRLLDLLLLVLVLLLLDLTRTRLLVSIT